VNYEDGHELESFITFLNAKAGTFRTSSGTLKPSAGRVKELDEVINSVPTVNADFVAKIKESAEKLAENLQAFAKIYVTVAEKIASKGATYIETELTRLSNVLHSASVTPERKTDLMLKYNVLKAYAKEEVPAEDAGDREEL